MIPSWSILAKTRDWLAGRGLLLQRYDRPALRVERLHRIGQAKKERTLLLSPIEACQILSAVQATEKVPGAMAEIGVFEGVSAKLIASTSPARPLYLFDTFEGLPDVDKAYDKRFAKGQFLSEISAVKKYLANLNVHFCKGLFPASAADLGDLRFSFVHLDVDLYRSTKDSLEWLYPRMSRGGIILSHDYLSADGVTQAFSEFFADRPEPVLELTGWQCIVVKL